MKLSTILKPVLFLISILYSSGNSTDWRAINGTMIYKGSTPFKIKGVNFFGFETCDVVIHGLWKHPLTWYLDFLQQHKFNVIRLPFSQQWVRDSFEFQHPTPWSITADPSLQGKTSLQIMDILFEECRKRGIFVLLDMHRLKCDAQSHELWYSLNGGGFTHLTFMESWQKMIDRYAKMPNFFGIDLLNEPRGITQWGTNPSTSWNLFVESAFATLKYDGIILAEGVQWGRSLENMKDFPIHVNDTSRIVFSSHVYGPSVVGNMDLNPEKLKADWNKIFGYLVQEGKTVIIGESGGFYEGADKEWQDAFIDYLISQRISLMYWTLNANSIDTAGLLDNDWTTPKLDKLNLLDKLQPYPTIIMNISDSVINVGKQVRYLRVN